MECGFASGLLRVTTSMHLTAPNGVDLHFTDDADEQVTALVRETVDKPNSKLLEELRELEKEMKLVYTMVSGASWRVVEGREGSWRRACARPRSEVER